MLNGDKCFAKFSNVGFLNVLLKNRLMGHIKNYFQIKPSKVSLNIFYMNIIEMKYGEFNLKLCPGNQFNVKTVRM